KDLKGSSRGRFEKEALLCGEQPGSELTLEFEGTAVGAYVLAGPDAGIVETSVDGGPYRPTNLFHRFSGGLHYPRTVVFNADLAPGPHVLRLRIANSKDPASLGHALRVLNFVAN
ncbi:MAG: SGNH/GDSL hydrolase family protein, partial [Planctomycetota bacterium]